MAELKIASINLNTGIDKITVLPLNSNQSLSQYDIILFNLAGIPGHIDGNIVDYWHHQLQSAYNNNRLVIVLMHMNYVLSQHPFAEQQGCYWILPFAPACKQATIGTDIKACISNNKPVLDFINNIKTLFGDGFCYTSTFENNNSSLSPILTNHDGEPVGFLNQDGKRCCLLIPQIGFEEMVGVARSRFIGTDNEKARESHEKKQNRFLGALVALYKALHSGNTYETEPEWLMGDDAYKTKEEIDCETSVRVNEVKIVEIDQENNRLKKKCLELGQLRHLLFAHDKPLENAINTAMQILGAEATEYDNVEHTLQIDSLMRYGAVTLLGEAKGHEGYANNDGINQLIANRGTYYELECEEKDEVPKAVLFINSQRKTELSMRDKSQCCTAKVKKMAEANSVAIVLTSDLFFIAKYIKDTNDTDFAKRCMEAIIQSRGGMVEFPEVPTDIKQ